MIPSEDFEFPLISVKNRNFFHKKHFSNPITIHSPTNTSHGRNNTFGKKKTSIINNYLQSYIQFQDFDAEISTGRSTSKFRKSGQDTESFISNHNIITRLSRKISETRKQYGFLNKTQVSSQRLHRKSTAELDNIKKSALQQVEKLLEDQSLYESPKMNKEADEGNSARNKKKIFEKKEMISNIRFSTKFRLQEMQTKFWHQNVRESDIPLTVLYNDTINKIKLAEKQETKEPKALTFTIKTAKGSNNKSIRFEILGENTQLEVLHDEDERDENKESKDVEEETEISDLKLITQQDSNQSEAKQDGKRKSQQFLVKLNEKVNIEDKIKAGLFSRFYSMGKKKTSLYSPMNLSVPNFQKMGSLQRQSQLQLTPKIIHKKTHREEDFIQIPVLGQKKTLKQNSLKKGGTSMILKESRLEQILETSARRVLNNSSVINVDLSPKLPNLAQATNNLKRIVKQKTKIEHKFQKKDLFKKWFLSPKQMSERCKLIEQKSKPSQERDQSFQDRKKAKQVIGDLIKQYEFKEEIASPSDNSSTLTVIDKITPALQRYSNQHSWIKRATQFNVTAFD